MSAPKSLETAELTDLEITLLFEAVFQRRGFDFRAYDARFVRDRISRYLRQAMLATVSALQERVLHDEAAMDQFLQSFMAEATPVFFEPAFFATFSRQVIGLLRPLATARVWVAECDSSADAFSLSILLREASLPNQLKLYATGMNESVVEAAKRGLVPAPVVKGRALDYRRSGGKRKLVECYSLKAGQARMARSLYEHIVWGQHNLVTDASLNQFHCIVSRNTLGRFSPMLSERVSGLLYESLTVGGVLGVGGVDDLRHSPYTRYYEPLDEAGLWYRKSG